MIKVIAFDVFGTVFDLSGIPKQEIKDYINHIRKPVWEPLKLPEHWARQPAHTDASFGIGWLRSKYMVVTCSNGPLGLLTKLSKFNGVTWDAIIPLELNRVYKPNPKAYLTVCEVLDVLPEEVLMVTANKTFGDLEASVSVGMKSILIRGDDGPKTIIELAEQLC